MLLNWTKEILAKYRIKPKKMLGQNFLIDEQPIQMLINAANITEKDVVIEVGAGIGTISRELAKRAKKVIAVEKDKGIIPALAEYTKNLSNVEIVEGDVLKIVSLRETSRREENWKLIGNIPYYLTAPLMRTFLETENPPRLMVLMVQKEMAERISAKPLRMSILAVSVQIYAKPEIVAYVPRSAFWPQPKVDSAILKVSDINPSALSMAEREAFFKIVKAGFSSPRKQLINNFSKGFNLSKEKMMNWLKAAGIDPQRRAETLSVHEWKNLVKLSPLRIL